MPARGQGQAGGSCWAQGDPQPALPPGSSCGARGPGARAAKDARRRWHGWPGAGGRRRRGASGGAGGGCQAGAGMLQASWAFVPLRVDGPAPCTAFVRKASGSSSCALKIHIKSIFRCLLGVSSCHCLAAAWVFVGFQDRRGHH